MTTGGEGGADHHRRRPVRRELQAHPPPRRGADRGRPGVLSPGARLQLPHDLDAGGDRDRPTPAPGRLRPRPPRNAAYLSEHLGESRHRPAVRGGGRHHSYYKYVCRLRPETGIDIEHFVEAVRAEGLPISRRYPDAAASAARLPRPRPRRPPCPVTERLSSELFSLLVHPTADIQDMDDYARAISKVLAGSSVVAAPSSGPVTPERWADLERLFTESAGEELGNPSRCWCMEYRLADYDDWLRGAGDRNREAMRHVVEPPARHRESSRTRTASLQAGALSRPGQRLIGLRRPRRDRDFGGPTWSIVCFYVAEPHRGHGLMQAARWRPLLTTRGIAARRLVKVYPFVPELADDGAERAPCRNSSVPGSPGSRSCDPGSSRCDCSFPARIPQSEATVRRSCVAIVNARLSAS